MAFATKVSLLSETASALSVTDECETGINTDQIVLSISDGKQPVIKLAGACYQRQLVDLNRSNPFANSYVEERIPESW